MSKVKDFTGGSYKELKNKGNNDIITGSFITDLVKLLRKSGISCPDLNGYDDVAEEAVMRFQKANGLSVTGILDNETLTKLYEKSGENPDTIASTSSATTSTGTASSETSPHFDSWFDTDMEKNFRRNHKDIKITFGNNSVVKTLKDVFMISQSVEVDTSGNTIYETYQFIARDVIESDEPLDSNKYSNDLTTITNGYSSSDIKYNYADLI